MSKATIIAEKDASGHNNLDFSFDHTHIFENNQIICIFKIIKWYVFFIFFLWVWLNDVYLILKLPKEKNDISKKLWPP
jgi:hypothetical protein